MLTPPPPPTSSTPGVSAEVEYSLVDAEEEQLLVDTNSGVITLGRPLDREQQPMYNISVRVADRGTPSLSSTAVVILLVQGRYSF